MEGLESTKFYCLFENRARFTSHIMTPAEVETQYIVDICHYEACLCLKGENVRPLEMSQSTDIADTASSDIQPDILRPEEATAGSTAIHPSSAPLATHDSQVPDFFKPGHVAQIPLHTLQDVTRARHWIQLVSFQTRPVLSDLEFSFRALYDGLDSITRIRVTRFIHRHQPHLNPGTELAACLRLHNQDSRIPARALSMFNEATKDGGVWIARHWTDESRNLQVGCLNYVWLWYYNFFKDISLRKEGKDWDGADLESVIEFFADLRAR
jgi:hypothetical protein